MPKPICVKCKRFFKPAWNGVVALEQMPLQQRAEPGTGDEGLWTPMKIWQADLLRCAGCGDEIIVGFGRRPIAEHYEDRFARALDFVTHTVNDC